MKRPRRNHTTAFKANVALAARPPDSGPTQIGRKAPPSTPQSGALHSRNHMKYMQKWWAQQDLNLRWID